MRGHHHDQSDMTLIACDSSRKEIGTLDYSVWRGKVAVQMITAAVRGLGVGPALVRELQRMYPTTEIDFGMLTADGAKMLAKMSSTFTPNPEFETATKRLAQLKAQEAKWRKLSDHFHANPTEAGRAKLRALGDRWNDLNDEVWQLENDLPHMKPGTRLINL